jgi:hypothetical protein
LRFQNYSDKIESLRQNDSKWLNSILIKFFLKGL